MVNSWPVQGYLKFSGWLVLVIENQRTAAPNSFDVQFVVNWWSKDG